MNAQALIDALLARGVVLNAVANRIEFDAPVGTVTDADLEQLRVNKTDVLRCLRLCEGLPADADAARLLDCDEVDPSDVPSCEPCGRLCDRQTLDDIWHCSQCDDRAKHGPTP